MRFDLATMARRTGRRRSTAMTVIKPTKAQAHTLARIYLRLVRRWQEATTGPIMRAYELSLAQAAMRDSLVRDDAVSTSGSVDGAGEGLLRLILDLMPELQEWVVQIERWHRGRWVQASLSASGVDVSTMVGASDVRETLEAVLARNAALIRDVSEQARGRIADIVLRGLQARTPAREVAKELAEAIGLARKRSLRIASDQLNKLTAELDAERQRQAGIEEWIWRHSGKLHPRENHLARNLKHYTDADAPNDLPGQLPNCGCRRQAYLNLD